MLKTKWLCYKTYFSGFNISPGLNHIGIKLGFQPRCTFVLQKNYSNTIYFWCKDQQEKYFFKDFYFLWQKKKKKITNISLRKNKQFNAWTGKAALFFRKMNSSQYSDWRSNCKIFITQLFLLIPHKSRHPFWDVCGILDM